MTWQNLGPAVWEAAVEAIPFDWPFKLDAASVAMTLSLSPDETGILQAVSLLRQGELVAFPTETVYGLGGDARSDAAVAGIYAAKGRPSFNPLILHVPDLAAAEEIAVVGPQARKLAKAFWPGPLTLVLPLRDRAEVSPLVTAGLATVAIRVPARGKRPFRVPPNRRLSQQVSQRRMRVMAGPLETETGRSLEGGGSTSATRWQVDTA